MHISRRQAIAGFSSAALFPEWAAAQNIERVPSLKSIANPKGIEIGSIHKTTLPQGELDLIRTHCNLLVPENGMKSSWLYPTKETKEFVLEQACGKSSLERDKSLPCFEAADRAVNFARRNGLSIHGHALYWPNKQLPQDVITRHGGFVTDAYRAHIHTLVSRYPDAVSWDVLNEVLVKEFVDLRKDGWRALRPDKSIGSDPNDLLKFYAHIINTMREVLALHYRSASLMLNDFHLSGRGTGYNAKRQAVLDLVDELAQLEAPLDGVGIQSHISANIEIDYGATVAFIRALADREMVVYISELDITAAGRNGSDRFTPANHKMIVEGYLTAVLAEPNVKRLSFWGLSDANHNFVTNRQAYSKWPEPTLFDEDYVKKPVFDGVVSALQAAPARG